MASAATIQHPTLGTVQGKAADDGSGVTQFLGVKYASLKDRFAPPELIKGDPAGAVDAKEFGPHVVCLPGAIDMEMSYIQQTLPKPANPPITSDTEGLNLNITVPPAGTPKPAGGFPVLAFIHGGGLFIGANWWPQYDFKRLVKFGAETGRPFIGVNIGYRLGIPGFLTSAEMRQAGYKANNGLRDQATALQWIKHHIAGFGGDPANVTAMGESAGGASALAHLQSPIPLFARIISMAGTPLMMQPLSPPVADHAYALITAAFGLADLAPPARLAALRTLPVPDLLAKAPPGAPLLLVEDGDAVRATPSHARLAPSLAPGAGGWCAEILAGWCGADANILTHMIPALRSGEVARIFTASFEKSLAERPGVAGRLFEAYGIRAEGEAKGALPRIVALASDLLFRASARAYVDGWPEGRKTWPDRADHRPPHASRVSFHFPSHAYCPGELREDGSHLWRWRRLRRLDHRRPVYAIQRRGRGF